MWADIREADPLFAVIGKPSEKLHQEIGEIAQGYEHVVIDGVPRTASVTRSGPLRAKRGLAPAAQMRGT